MAEPSEGTYIILSVGSLKAMDVKGSSDVSETTIRQYEVTKNDSQIWAVTQPESDPERADGHWQVICSLTGKCLGIDTDEVEIGSILWQEDDEDVETQRWLIKTDGSEFEYDGETYPTYYISPLLDNTKALRVNTLETNVYVSVLTDPLVEEIIDDERWVFIPMPPTSDGGTYNICLASDPTVCLEVASSSTANLAYIQTASINDQNNQAFLVDVNEETFATRFINANSRKAIDLRGTQIVQNAVQDLRSQRWMLYQNGNQLVNGNNVPTYCIVSLGADSLVLSVDSDGSVKVMGPGESDRQSFILVKTEMHGESIEIPGRLTRTIITRNNAGEVEVRQLNFRSSYTEFQGRYKIRRYGINKLSYTDSEWMNVINHSTARDGWGDAWEASFTSNITNGYVSMPFNKTYELTALNQYIDLIFEIRAYVDPYGEGFIAHGPVQQSTVSLVISPSLELDQVLLVPDAENKSLTFKAFFSAIGGLSVSRITGQWFRDDGEPFTEINSSGNLSLEYSAADGMLYGLPNEGERITLEFTLRISSGETTRGTYAAYFSYGGELNDSVAIVESTDGSATLTVSSIRYNMTYCFIEVPYMERTRLISCEEITQTDSSLCHWKVLPALNQNQKIIVIGGSSSTAWHYAFLTKKVSSHLFIWNWTRPQLTSYVNDPYNDFCTVIVNTDNPPQQTRTFKATQSFLSPIGRVHPVAFSGVNVTLDMAVEGVAIDEDANYEGGELPPHSSVQHIQKLVRLAGYAIHPIYRTPYGDWYQVAVEEVDVSKTEMQKSTVKVQQQVVSD